MVQFPGSIIGAAIDLFGNYITAQKANIQAVDRGIGVYLTLPWVSLWWDRPASIIVAPRPAVDPSFGVSAEGKASGGAEA